MSKILTFKGKGATVSDSAFLQDDSGTFDFKMDGNGHFDFKEPVLAFMREQPDNRTSDWSNQELADLFLVKRLLNTSGVVCDIERGLTDEGDPWCVFCDSHGEVFIHFCRIDGLYLLDSPNLERPLRGTNFSELVSDFSNRAIPSRTSDDPAKAGERRVVHFKRNGKVHLHPSALLSALIWTLFLASEELVLVTDQDHVDGGSETGPDTADAALSKDVQADAIESFSEKNLLKNIPEDAFCGEDNELIDEDGGCETKSLDLHVKDINPHQGLVTLSNVYAIGLSTLAVTCGLMSKSIWLDASADISGNLDENKQKTVHSEKNNDESSESQTQDGHMALESFFDALLSIEITEDLALLRDTVLAALNTEDPTVAPGEVEINVPPLATQASSDLETSDAPEISAISKVSLSNSDVAPDLSMSETEAQKNTASTPEQGNEADPAVALLGDLIHEAPQGLSNIMNAWQPVLQKTALDNIKIYSSFDINQFSDQRFEKLSEVFSVEMKDDQELIEDTSDDTDGTLWSFDEKAKHFIGSFLDRHDSIEMIYKKGNLILIDLDAFNSSGGETHIMSWEFDDGSVVSTVGLKTDYETFDLIA